MKIFYVSFGLGSILRGYHAVFEAKDEDIVRAYCNKHFRSLWSNVYSSEPTHSKPLRDEHEVLFYNQAEHV
jgi:hypothetical protein